ncbi:MAG: hypothetical protein E7254_09370 [Lachnospiraceae bacterium]|nr:hypothetical protein [Lachnospiraceae bacterium]
MRGLRAVLQGGANVRKLKTNFEQKINKIMKVGGNNMNKATKTIICFWMIVSMVAASITGSPMGTGIAKVEAATKKVQLNKKKVTLYEGKTFVLKLKNNKKKVKWKSSDNKIVTVSKNGKLKAKKAGKATVTAKVGKRKYKCKVTVRKKAEQPILAENAATTKKYEYSSEKENAIETTEAEAITTAAETATAAETTTVAPTTTQAPTTVEPTTTAEVITIAEVTTAENIGDKNSEDVKVLRKLIKEQKEAGALVSENLDSEQYEWDEEGKLIRIDWEGLDLKGDLNVDVTENEFSKLKYFYFSRNEGLENITIRGLKSWENSYFGYLDNLKKVILEDCTALESVYIDCTDVNELVMRNLDSLYYFKYFWGRFGKMTVEKCDGVDNMYIWDCEIGDVDFTKFRNLEYVQMVSCTSEKDLNMTNLKKLEDFYFSNRESCRIEELNYSGKVKVNLSGCTSLRSVHLENCDIVENCFEHDYNLESLECINNDINELDLSGFGELLYFQCCGNDVTELDFSNCMLVWYINCENTKISELNLTKNPLVTEVVCDDGVKIIYPSDEENPDDVELLKKIISEQKKRGADVSEDLTSEQYEWCSQPGKNKRLIGVDWRGVNITGIEIGEPVSENDSVMSDAFSELEYFYLDDNPELENVIVQNCPSIKSLTGSWSFAARNIELINCDSIEKVEELLMYPENGVSTESLTLIDCDNIEYCYLYEYAGLKRLEIKECEKIEWVCVELGEANKLEELQLENNPNMCEVYLEDMSHFKTLYIENVRVSELDISKCPVLEYLHCKNTDITELNIGNNPELKVIELDEDVNIFYENQDD